MHKLKKSLILLVISLSVLSSACAYTPLREHPTLENQLGKINRIVVAPPEVTVERITFIGSNERLPELEQTIKAQLNTLAQEKIKQHNFEFVEFDFASSQKSNPTLAFSLEQVKESYSEARETLYAKQLSKKDIRSVEASVGSVINSIAETTKSDAVLMLSYAGVRKSSGKMAQEYISSILLGLLTGVAYAPARDAAVVEAALLDAISGDVLWVNSSQGLALDNKVFNKAMKSFPDNISTGEESEEDYDGDYNDDDVALEDEDSLEAAI